jgi:dienelactone hydrolase
MINRFTPVALAAALLATLPISSLAAQLDGTWKGQLTCSENILNNRVGFSRTMQAVMAGQNAQADISTPETHERVNVSLNGGGLVSVALEGQSKQNPEARWLIQAVGSLAGDSLSADGKMLTPDGNTVVRHSCRFELVRTGPISGQTARAEAAPAQRIAEPRATTHNATPAAAATKRLPLLATPAESPKWKDAPAYAPELSRNVLQRSTFFLPMFSAVYREKFEGLINQLPEKSLRGVVIHNHGCGGIFGTETDVAYYFYKRGFAVVLPEFVTREGNKMGCPGGSAEEMLRMAGERSREGVYQAINPARLAARGEDVQVVIDWLKSITRLPILISGHSEGCRTMYSMHITDPQVRGGICIKQGLQPHFEHTWRWNTQKPMWQSLEEFDPWVVTHGLVVGDVNFARKFADAPQNHTVVIVPGKTHDPLNQEAERSSLNQWLNTQVGGSYSPGLNGFNYEGGLPAVQKLLRR